MPELFHNFPRNVLAIFRGRNLLAHAAAIFLTILIVESGLDWAYYREPGGQGGGRKFQMPCGEKLNPRATFFGCWMLEVLWAGAWGDAKVQRIDVKRQ
jgi:hypothetical protein